MQRENKWQDRKKYLGRIVDILSYQSAITAQGIKYDGEKDWALNKILDLIDTAIAEERERVVDMIEKSKVGTLFGETIWIETLNEGKIKLAKKFLNDKIDEADALLLTNTK